MEGKRHRASAPEFWMGLRSRQALFGSLGEIVLCPLSVGRLAGASTHCCGPSPTRAFSSRNFRKHLRMVGSRRVKAQSKRGPGRGRRCAWQSGASWQAGFACWQSASISLFWPHIHTQAPPPPIGLLCLPLSSCPFSGVLLLSISVSVFCLVPSSVLPHLGPT